VRALVSGRQDLFDYIEMFYKLKLKVTNNGMLSPVDFEIWTCPENVESTN
jgi:hypothetical protein